MVLQQIAGAWDEIADFLLPRLCCACGQRVHQQKWLVCEACIDGIPPLQRPLCPTCGCPAPFIKPGGRCTNCPPGKTYFAQARGTAIYGGVAEILVERLKYKGRLEYAVLMAMAMARFAAEEHLPRPHLVTAVPLHRTRQRERGYNQADVLAREYCSLTGIPYDGALLRRIRPTPTQTRLTRRQRQQNIQGAFTCKPAQPLDGLHILLIDDVFTTGSTLNECAKTLLESGAARVECLTYARALLEK